MSHERKSKFWQLVSSQARESPLPQLGWSKVWKLMQFEHDNAKKHRHDTKILNRLHMYTLQIDSVFITHILCRKSSILFLWNLIRHWTVWRIRILANFISSCASEIEFRKLQLLSKYFKVGKKKVNTQSFLTQIQFSILLQSHKVT